MFGCVIHGVGSRWTATEVLLRLAPGACFRPESAPSFVFVSVLLRNIKPPRSQVLHEEYHYRSVLDMLHTDSPITSKLYD